MFCPYPPLAAFPYQPRYPPLCRFLTRLFPVFSNPRGYNRIASTSSGESSQRFPPPRFSSKPALALSHLFFSFPASPPTLSFLTHASLFASSVSAARTCLPRRFPRLPPGFPCFLPSVASSPPRLPAFSRTASLRQVVSLRCSPFLALCHCYSHPFSTLRPPSLSPSLLSRPPPHPRTSHPRHSRFPLATRTSPHFIARIPLPHSAPLPALLVLYAFQSSSNNTASLR